MNKSLIIDRRFLDDLAKIRQSLGAEKREYQLQGEIKIRFEDDIAGSLSEILQQIGLKEKGQPLLDRKGNCRFLYIPDHTRFDISELPYLTRDEDLRKVHISYCRTLEKMEYEGRGDRYSFTIEDSGFFDIVLAGDKKQTIELNICKNCIKAMKIHNINQYGSVDNFDYAKYAYDFKDKYPERFNKASKPKAKYDYPSYWGKISFNYRKNKGFICEDCGKDCSNDKRNLHTHHINGIKSDVSYSNLKALCYDCHAKQPFHSHMKKI